MIEDSPHRLTIMKGPSQLVPVTLGLLCVSGENEMEGNKIVSYFGQAVAGFKARQDLPTPPHNLSLPEKWWS